MKNICIQSGHWNVTTGQTGAPMEQKRTLAIGLKLVDLLRKQGYNVYHTDSYADTNKDVTSKDWDLFLALHCDANYAGDEGGGFVDFPEPSTDLATAESQRIAGAIESVYFKETGIINVPSRRNNNTKYYYMWSALSAKTPCVIIEMGESIDPHDSVILNDTDRVANALLKGINKAFPSVTPQPPAESCEAIKKDLEALKKEHSNCGESITTIRTLQEQVLILTRERQEAVNALKDVTDLKNRLLEKIDKAKVALN